MKLLLLLTAALLAGCANPPPMAKGPWHPLNEGKWAFNPNDLVQPPPGLTR